MVFGNKILQGNTVVPITFVQTGSMGESTAATVSIPYTVTPTSGNLLVAFLFPYAGGTLPANITAPGWTWHSSNPDTYLEIHFLTKISDGTETGSVTFTSDIALSRFFGVMVEYSGVSTGIISSDMSNARSNSSTDLFNNDSLPINNNSMYLACFGTTNTTIPADTPGNYIKRLNAVGSLNGIMIWDCYAITNDIEDGDITTGVSSSFCIMAGCIIK